MAKFSARVSSAFSGNELFDIEQKLGNCYICTQPAPNGCGLVRASLLRVTSFARCNRGVAAIEFAFIAPVLLIFLLGVICYGAYFWMAHDVQQLANDGARSAIAGLDAGERSTIARQTVQRNLGRQDGLVATKAAVSVQEGNDAFTVTVTYDASGSAFWSVMDLFPMPSTTIRRSATVTLGGY